MDRYFFFCRDFCEWVIDWAGSGDFSRDEKMVYVIREREMIGNLGGAIHGYEFTGFIGEVYKRFPFPESLAGFKQKPYGSRNRTEVERIIQSFAMQLRISVVCRPEQLTIDFGDYTFSAEVFREILNYIEGGGMPGWLNGQPPDYVNRMTAQLANTSHPILAQTD